MKNFYANSVIFLFLLRIAMAGCKSSKVTEESKYLGEWHYSFEMEGTEYAAYYDH